MRTFIQKSTWQRGFVFLALMCLLACGPRNEGDSQAQGFFPWSQAEPVRTVKTESGDEIPERVANFLQSAERFGEGVRRYQLGSYSRSVTDCSGFIGQAHRSSGYRVTIFQFDWDPLNFAGCTGQLRAGDVLLLGYPGRQPDHWVMMVDVRDPRGKFNAPENIIMDVSSDYVDGKPYFKGPLSRRKNLLARKVYACRRHRSFERDWKQMATQKKQEAQASEDNVIPDTGYKPLPAQDEAGEQAPTRP